MSSFESTRPKSKAVDRVHRYLADRAERIASEGRQELIWFPPQVLDDLHANDQEEVDDNFFVPEIGPHEMVLDIPARTLTYEQVLDLSVPAPAPMAVPGPGPVPPRQGGYNQPTQHPDPDRRRVQVHPGHPYPPPNSNSVPRPQTLPRHHAPPTDGQALGMTTPSRPPVHHAYPRPYPRLHGHHPPTSTLNAQAHIHAQHNYNHLLGEDEDAKYKRLGLATNADPGLPRGMGMERGMVGGSGSAHRAPNIPAFSHGHAHTHGRVQSSRVQPGYRQGHLGQDEDANFKRNLHNTLGITNANVNNAPSGGSSGAMGPSSIGLGNQRRITRPWEL